ncbi:ubiquitin carboxyl-terminal hydrolase 26 [Meriones unguiculatus]|uniref:ubiquitin carboxyl-terminal hydrolase 26 n=1 Tax=Meriones unguiculatus TaxID=10047 RepID=UPI000B4F8F07|nr:ubiquitin carboxyl-terminal hydrolase 26 [Meriones unguiculatus]
MDPISIHAQVQIWNAKAGMSKSRRALIETLVERKGIKLVLHFSTGKTKYLQLQNNIKSVVLRTYGEDQNYIHLTFKNNDFLFVEKLTSLDAKRLKKFLDRIHQKKFQASRRYDEGRAGSTSTSTGEFDGSSSLAAHPKASLEKAKERHDLPLPSAAAVTPDSAELLEKQHVKRKRFLPESEKKEKENVPKGSKKFETKIVVSGCVDKGEETSVREADQSTSGLEYSFVTQGPEETNLDVIDLHDLITKLFSPFLLEPHRIKKGIKWHEYMKILLLCPEKSWQGLPNVGNTCYINVVLQSLCSVPLFVNDLFNQGFPWIKPPRDDFNMRLMQLLVLKDIYNLKTREQLLHSITKALPAYGEIFAAYKQNDAHEFLSLCLVQLKETVQKLTIMWQSENGSGGNNLLRQIFANHTVINRTPVCPVANNFEFELLSSIFCKACGLTVFKREPSSFLSINIPQGKKDRKLSIQSSFDLFFRAEEVEHRCERCMHNRSIALHKFCQLPRVIIIHLKRYSFDESLVMRKDEQHIIIPKYLRLSYHCNKITKPPHPLSQNAHVKDLELLKPLEELGSEILRLSFNLLMTSRTKGFPTESIRSDKESEAPSVKKALKLFSEQVETKDPTEGATTNVPGSEQVKKEDKENVFSNFDSGSINEATRNIDLRIPERSQEYEQAQKCIKDTSDKQTSQETLTETHPDSSSQEQTENIGKPAESHTEDENLDSQASVDSSETPGNTNVLDKEKPTGKEEPQTPTKKEENVYRLLNIINHIGSSPNEGHYINDAFDFKKRGWFSYSDQEVTSVREDFVHKARLSTGYVFFYMHNDIFEELLARESQSSSTLKEQ